ncbi:MFS transporter, partial [Pseudomonas syringae pv. tagetis]
ILMTPTILQNLYGFPAATELKANSLAIVYLSLGCIASGTLADRFGAGRVLLLGSAGMLLSSWTLNHVLGSHPEMLFPQ